MPPLFPRWTNAAVRWGLALAAGALLAAPLLLMGWVRTPFHRGQYLAPEQPVAFDHRHHVVDDGIDCRYCHSEVERSPSAGIPSSDVCMNCHSQIWTSSPLLEPVRESYYRGVPIAWRRVHRLPDFVFFDHSIHVAKGVGCETCHGRVDRMARVRKAEALNMAWCLECHRDPEKRLRPLDEITTMGWTPEGPREDVGREVAERHDVRPGTDCTSCHR